MLAGQRLLFAMFFASVIVNAAARDLVVQAGPGAHYAMPYGDMYYPWVNCLPPYRCGDPMQMRLERERDRRLQELRERATPSEPQRYDFGDGPWGRQRYMPPPTPEANIQPAYRGASRLRPEFEQTGQPIGERAEEPR